MRQIASCRRERAPQTDYTHDLLGRETVTKVSPKPGGTALTSGSGTITPSQKVVFLIDAAGRHASQTIGTAPTTTYEYLGTSD